jgi:hypothetical protein
MAGLGEAVLFHSSDRSAMPRLCETSRLIGQRYVAGEDEPLSDGLQRSPSSVTSRAAASPFDLILLVVLGDLVQQGITRATNQSPAP